MVELRTEPTKIERRFVECAELRVAQDDGKPPRLVGYAAVFNKPSERMFGWRNDFVEYIAPGAFTASLARRDEVTANVMHRGGLDTLGSTGAATLRLSEDGMGLLADIDLPDTQAGRDVFALVKRKDLRKMSFAFETVAEKVERAKQQGEPDVRTLLEVRLFDVAVVDRPAYPDTTVAVRSLEAALADPGTPTDSLRRRLELEALDGR